VQSATRAPSPGDQLDPGERLEARLAQVWFWEGLYARRGVDFQRYFQEPLQVTDLDLLAFDLNPQLAVRRYIGEAKSGTGKKAPKPLDRIVWLNGLRSLVGADAAELTVATPVSATARALGRGLGVTAQHTDDLQRREADAVGAYTNLGSHGEAAFTIEKTVHQICKKDVELARAFAFLRGEALLLESFLAAKQLIELLRRIRQRWTPHLHDEEAVALRWLAAEAVSQLTLQMVAIAGMALTLDRQAWEALTVERLAEGSVPMRHMRALSDSVDKYVTGLLATADAPAELKAQALGAFIPSPPDYAEPFAELCWRLKGDAPAARGLPRQVDLLIHERLVHQRVPSELAVSRLGLNRDASTRLIRLVSGFLRGCDASFDAADQALIAPLPRP
jgi:hypothetical protein